ncbi:MAG: SGNH/GDSL hydrolase family protein [Clostridia bacterium]|nr:SGNH/GDSL hydrolase family protein [Clostridia bacterium]
MNDFFGKFTSNTLAGSGNQFIFRQDGKEIRTGRVFYKIFRGGRYDYSFLFSNVIDGTFADGSGCEKNHVCPKWTLYNLRAGKCTHIPADKEIAETTLSDDGFADIAVSDFKDVYFGGEKIRTVGEGETFYSDSVSLSFEKGEYLCLEITFSGTEIPYHEETLLPTFVKNGEKWEYSRKMPVASMIGCDRKTDGRIAFLGDSITQGIGTRANSYLHWNALFAEKLGGNYAYWNLGIGCGRASDAASDGAWLYKAKQNDLCFVCFGVNDILHGASAAEIIRDLRIVYRKLTAAGVKAVMLTVPPFEYPENMRTIWAEANRLILNEPIFSGNVFDVVPFLAESTLKPYNAKFGGHPNEKGCAVWADRLYTATVKNAYLNFKNSD